DAFGGLAAALPKAMLKVQGRPILARLLDDFASLGSRAAVVVRGHRAEAVDVAGARFVDNPDYATTGEAYSLSLAEEELGAGTLVAFRRHCAETLHRAGHPGGGRGRHHARRGQRAGRRRRAGPRARRPSGHGPVHLRGRDPPRDRRRGDPGREPRRSGSGSSTWAPTAPAGSAPRSRPPEPTAPWRPRGYPISSRASSTPATRSGSSTAAAVG